MFDFLHPTARYTLYGSLLLCAAIVGLLIPALGFNPNVTGLLVVVSIIAGALLSMVAAVAVDQRIREDI